MFFFILFFGEVVPQFVHESVVLSFLKKNRDYGQLSLLVGMHKMHRHFISLAIDPLLARTVKVELF